jgi:hypothetical protein
MSKLKSVIRNIKVLIKEVLKHYPLVLSSAFFADFFTVLSIQFPIRKQMPEGHQLGWLANNLWQKLILVMGMGISLSYLCYHRSHKAGKNALRWPSLPLLSGYYFVFPDAVHDFLAKNWVLLVIMVMLHHLAITFYQSYGLGCVTIPFGVSTWAFIKVHLRPYCSPVVIL